MLMMYFSYWNLNMQAKFIGSAKLDLRDILRNQLINHGSKFAHDFVCNIRQDIRALATRTQTSTFYDPIPGVHCDSIANSDFQLFYRVRATIEILNIRLRNKANDRPITVQQCSLLRHP